MQRPISFGTKVTVSVMVGKMEAKVIELENSLVGVNARMSDIEGSVEARYLQPEERRVAFESKCNTVCKRGSLKDNG